MSAEVNPELLLNLKKFGVADAAACFNCGNCTAVCSLSSESIPFPRKVIRYLQLGLKDKLFESPEPWLCYYCGDCSETCPRQANPGEVMMGLRRYLTSRYDWTGISRLFYTSKVFEVAAILAVAALVGLGFYFFHGPMPTDRVARFLGAAGLVKWEHGNNPNKAEPGEKAKERAAERAHVLSVNEHARIFCQNLQADLVSIAGTYLRSDEIPEAFRGKPAQIYLANEALVVTAL